MLSGETCEIVIATSDGREVERVDAETLAASMTETGRSYADLVATLAKDAARIARGTERAIQVLLAAMHEIAAVENENQPGDDMPED